jgi:hypothetical protein
MVEDEGSDKKNLFFMLKLHVRDWLKMNAH